MYGKFMGFAIASAIALLLAQNASARFEIVERSFESSTAEAQIPAAQNASLAMRQCPDCATVTLRITPETRFFVDEQQVTQTELRKAADRGTHLMTVYFAPESKVVTRIVMHTS